MDFPQTSWKFVIGFDIFPNQAENAEWSNGEKHIKDSKWLIFSQHIPQITYNLKVLGYEQHTT